MNIKTELGFQVTDEAFQNLRALLYQESGISLSDAKKSLVVSRLSKRLRHLGLKSFQAYYDYVKGDQGSDEFIQMLDHLTTNKTDFFREPVHFEFMKEQVLPKLEVRKQVSIWSSASSSGEEPYTIAMTLYEGVQNPAQWKFRILASDLSTRALEKASTGVYDMERVQNLPKSLLKRHFLRGKGRQDGKVRIKEHLADIVAFRRINLMEARYPIKTPLDLIFCRNVMIYFDRPTQERLIAKFYDYLKPGGYLFIGHSESLHWLKHPFYAVAPTIYQKRENDLP